MSKHTKTNLEHFDAMTDDMIDTSDILPLTDEFFETAEWRMPEQKVKITVEVEPKVVEWFKAQGENYERYLAAALRIYAQAHQATKKTEAGYRDRDAPHRAPLPHHAAYGSVLRDSADQAESDPEKHKSE